jgi:hypothetical protein
MAKMKQGIFGGLSGKVGNLTGSSWKGTPVVKSRPQSVAYPATTGQVAQTTKMSAIVAFCKPILSGWIKPLWDRAAVGMSGYNAFVKANIAEFADGEIDDYANLIMSKGTMQAPVILTSALSAGAGDLHFSWQISPLTGLELATDIAYCLYINETTGAIHVSSGNIRSSSGYILLLDENLVEGDIIHLYLAFKRANGTVISNNAYRKLIVSA